MSYHTHRTVGEALGASASFTLSSSAFNRPGGTITGSSSTSNPIWDLTKATLDNLPGGAANQNGPSVADEIARRAAAAKAAQDADTAALISSNTLTSTITVPTGPTGPQPVVYDKDGLRYTAYLGVYGNDPAWTSCQGGNQPPCACATVELKDAILKQGYCKVGNIPKAIQIRGIGADTAYNTAGRPAETFKWFDLWIAALGDSGINPCDIVRLPTCRVDCNAPWYEPVRLSGEYGYCRSTRVEQVATAYKPKTVCYGSGTVLNPVTGQCEMPTAITAYVPQTPPQTVLPCPGGMRRTSGGCMPEMETGTTPTPASSSFMTTGWWLILLAAAGGGYYLYTKSGKKTGASR